MITRIKDEGGSYRVTILAGEGVIEERVTADIKQAFAWQAHVQTTGSFPPDPVVKHEPEVVKSKGKKK